MGLDRREPGERGGARTVWGVGLLELPCEDQHEGSRGVQRLP